MLKPQQTKNKWWNCGVPGVEKGGERGGWIEGDVEGEREEGEEREGERFIEEERERCGVEDERDEDYNHGSLAIQQRWWSHGCCHCFHLWGILSIY